jgi:tetratricopeptide (TPR) repeat protein
VTDRLLVDLADGQVNIANWRESELPESVFQGEFAWPLEPSALEDLRWYLEDYLQAPYGVWEQRGPRIQAGLAGWGAAVFEAVFGPEPARYAYQRARDRGLELVFRSAEPGWLGLPWELMDDGAGPAVLGLAGISRALRVADQVPTAQVAGDRLRVLMVISRPAGTRDVGYQMIARPLLERLEAVRGQVDLVVLRPPTLDALRDALAEAADAGMPFQIVHFDGHGVQPARSGRRGAAGRPVMMTGPAPEGVLAFEKPGGGSDPVEASRLAAVLREAGVPVVILNACQSGAIGKQLEASVAARLLREGCAAVVAMAYSVYAVAAAEFVAVLYERLFAGDTLSAAVTAGRRRLFEQDRRPSPKGELPLADWLVPVHYLRRDVAFPQARTPRPPQQPSLDEALNQVREREAAPSGGTGSLDPVGVFTGRDDLIFELDAAARLERVVVLHGPGGTGKTELAKAFGRWWRDTGGVERPGWVLWHSFEPGIASFGLDGVITQTGLAIFGADFAALGQADRQRVVEGLLADRRLLLIWDNFETVHAMPAPGQVTPPLDEAERAKVKGFLARLAAQGTSAVIITSRTGEDWLGQVRRIAVGGLAREEAAQYATKLLAPYPAAGPRRARRAFGELLEWLDGHPLSMRLILPRLAATDPEDLLAGLHGTIPLPGAGDDPGGDRATSLAASISYSFTHLTDHTRRLLPAIGLYHGIAAAAVLAVFSDVPGVPGRFAGATGEDWDEALQDATRVGLLTALGAGMYRIHPALPAYLAAQWRADDPGSYDGARDAATRALATAYAELGNWLLQQVQAGDAGLAYALIGLQRGTMGAVLSYALDHQMWDEASAIVQPLDYYWDAQGLGGEASAWTDLIQAATENPDGTPPGLDTPAGALWLFITGAQANRQQRARRLDDAEHTYRQILGMLQAQPPSHQQQAHLATTYHLFGVTAQARGQPDQAEDWYRQSLTIEEKLGNRTGMAATYHQLGMLAQDRGQLDQAEDWYRQSLAIEEDLGNQASMATSYRQIGRVAQARGQLDQAEDWYRQSLAIEEDLGNRPSMASTYHQIGNVAYLRGQLEQAEDWYRRSLAIKEDLGDRSAMAASYHQLGMLAQDRGQLDQAEDWYRQALAIAEDLGNRSAIAGTYHQFGTVAQDRGQLDQAEDWYRQSLAIDEALGNQASMASSFHQLGMIAQDRSQLDQAEDWYRQALAIAEDLGDRPRMALTLVQLAVLAEQRHQPRQALEWVVRSVALFDDFPHPGTGTGPAHLSKLAHELGEHAVDEAWQETTGQPLPASVREWVLS